MLKGQGYIGKIAHLNPRWCTVYRPQLAVSQKVSVLHWPNLEHSYFLW